MSHFSLRIIRVSLWGLCWMKQLQALTLTHPALDFHHSCMNIEHKSGTKLHFRLRIRNGVMRRFYRNEFIYNKYIRKIWFPEICVWNYSSCTLTQFLLHLNIKINLCYSEPFFFLLHALTMAKCGVDELQGQAQTSILFSQLRSQNQSSLNGIFFNTQNPTRHPEHTHID